MHSQKLEPPQVQHASAQRHFHREDAGVFDAEEEKGDETGCNKQLVIIKATGRKIMDGDPDTKAVRKWTSRRK